MSSVNLVISGAILEELAEFGQSAPFISSLLGRLSDDGEEGDSNSNRPAFVNGFDLWQLDPDENVTLFEKIRRRNSHDLISLLLEVANRSTSDIADIIVEASEVIPEDWSAEDREGLFAILSLGGVVVWEPVQVQGVVGVSPQLSLTSKEASRDCVELGGRVDPESISSQRLAPLSEPIYFPCIIGACSADEYRLEWLKCYDFNWPDLNSLWRGREDAFRRVHFLERVASDIVSLDAASHESVRRLLLTLERSALEWNLEADLFPPWDSLNVTPESETRINKGVVDFRVDGAPVTFSTHARFTPGAGRVHMNADRGTGRILVAYIGKKLGV